MRIIFWFFLFININFYSQSITVSDSIFKLYLLKNKKINLNGDNEIQQNEANSFDGNIDCSGLQITDLSGIQEFKNLSSLSCFDNKLKALDVSLNKALTDLDCSNNQIEALNLSCNPLIENLVCSDNKLKALDVSFNTALIDLNCSNNQIEELNFSYNPLIENLVCSDNKLTYLDISNCKKLKRLDCKNNLLQFLDLEKTVKISWVSCESNPFECVSMVPMECLLIGGKRCQNSFMNKVAANKTNFKNTGERGGLIKLRKSGIPLNGIVKFSNGELLCVEGKIVLQTIYFKNGNLKSRCEFRDGNQNGLQEFFYKNGRKKYITVIETKIIDNSGSKKQKIVYIQFWLKEYFRNGQLKTDIVYKNGLIFDKICYNKRGECIKCKLF